MSSALALGRRRGLIELRQSLTTPADLWNHLFWPVLMLVTLFFLRGHAFRGTGFALGALALPSILGMNASMAMMTMSQQLTADREDGTLLRAKALPNGMRAYLVGRVLSVAGTVLIDLALFLGPGVALVPGFSLGRPAGWLWLAAVLLLCLLATLPIGAVLGSLFSSTRGQSLLTLPILGLIGISGIFYPIAALPGWVRDVAQVFPVYWTGLGMRAALLPGPAAQLEIGGSWRPVETVLVLLAWAVAGLALAPPVLRRMARRESGSRLAERKERALRRSY
jgi:ABC-2 type transport system permease protein